MDVLCGLLALAFVAGVLYWMIETHRARKQDEAEKAARNSGGGGGPTEPA